MIQEPNWNLGNKIRRAVRIALPPPNSTRNRKLPERTSMDKWRVCLFRGSRSGRGVGRGGKRCL